MKGFNDSFFPIFKFLITIKSHIKSLRNGMFGKGFN